MQLSVGSWAGPSVGMRLGSNWSSYVTLQDITGPHSDQLSACMWTAIIYYDTFEFNTLQDRFKAHPLSLLFTNHKKQLALQIKTMY